MNIVNRLLNDSDFMFFAGAYFVSGLALIAAIVYIYNTMED